MQKKSSLSSDLLIALAPLLFSFFFLCLQISLFHKIDPTSTDWLSVGSAHSLLTQGLFAKQTDQSHKTDVEAGSFKGDRVTSPFYPVFLMVTATLLKPVETDLICLSDKTVPCLPGTGLSIIFYIQLIIASVAAFMLYQLALVLSGRDIIAWTTLVLALLAGRFADSAFMLGSGVFHYLFFFAASLAIVNFYKSGKKYNLLLAGACVGALVLLHTPYIALVPIWFVLILSFTEFRNLRTLATRGVVLLYFISAICVVLSPALLRSYLLFGDVYFSYEADRTLLAERVAFMTISQQDFWFVTVSGVPVLGSLFEAFFWDASQLVAMKKSWIALSVPAASYKELWISYILPDFWRSFQISTALLSRSLFAGGGVIALIGAGYLWSLLYVLKKRQQLQPFLLVLIPLVSMLIINSLVTLNLYTLNLPLIFIYCYALAYMKGSF